MRETFLVPDMSCGHCKQTVEGALRPVEGVHEAVVDLESKKVDVSFDEQLVSRDRLMSALEEAGYPVAG